MAKASKEADATFVLKPRIPRAGNPKREQRLVFFYKGGTYNLSKETVELTQKEYKRTGKIVEKTTKIKPVSSAELKTLYDSSPVFQKTIQAPDGYTAKWAK